MTEVLEGELVPSAPSNTLENRSAIPPKKQEAVLEIINEADPEKGKLFTFAQLAREARVPVKAFEAEMARAVEDPRHKLHLFALDVHAAWAKQQRHLMEKAYQKAEEKGKWEGFFTFLERLYPDEFKKPSTAQSTVTQNIGVVEKLALISNRGEITTGD